MTPWPLWAVVLVVILVLTLILYFAAPDNTEPLDDTDPISRVRIPGKDDNDGL